MKTARALIWIVAAAALAWADNASAGVRVRTHTPARTTNYWIVRTSDLRRERARRPHASLKDILQLYRQRSLAEGSVQTKPRVGYSIFPECRGDPKEPAVLADGGQAEAWVDC